MSIRFRLGARYRKVTAKQCHPPFGGTPGDSPRTACSAETRRWRVGRRFNHNGRFLEEAAEGQGAGGSDL